MMRTLLCALSFIVATAAFAPTPSYTTALAAQAKPARPSYKTWQASQAAKAPAAAAVAAREAKMAAVNKVTSMLNDLKNQVLEEGEKEAATYNKFACFCKDTQEDKSDAIKAGKDEKTSLTADVKRLSQERADLDKKIGACNEDIQKAEKEMKAATDKSDAARAVYEKNAEDMDAALYGISGAMKVLKSSKSPSLIQFQSIAETVRRATLLADVLGLGGPKVESMATLFMQQTSDSAPKVEMEDYKFHSSGIIGTLEKLMDDFRKQKQTLDTDEVKREQDFKVFIQDKTNVVKVKTHEMDEAKKNRDERTADISTASEELTTTSATLLDDMQYLDELNTVCSQKAKTWDQRSKVRANELSALTQAIGIITTTVTNKTQASTIRFAQTQSVLHLADAIANSDSAMEAIEAEAESVDGDTTPLGFLQRKATKNQEPDRTARRLVVTLLTSKGKQLHSTMLSGLAARIEADPFAKVKKLVQELIERLLTEAANEANQKGWCDKATAEAEQKRDMAADEIEDLNAKMAKLEALTDKLKEEIANLNADYKKLDSDRLKADQNRKDEKAENANTVSEAKIGKQAVAQAIDILDKFYKTAANSKVAYSLSQGPLDDAPDAGFDNGEAYQGANAEAGGILGMMEVIESDFDRTIEETTKAEESASEEHLQFMTEAESSLAEKSETLKSKKKLKDETDSDFSDAEDELDSQVSILKTSIKELMELKKTCVDTGMSYADREALREEEIASLKKALCIVSSFSEYGSDGTSKTEDC